MLSLIDSRARQVDVRRALLWIVATPPIVVGWVVGVVIYALAFLVQAFLVGYQRGRGLSA